MGEERCRRCLLKEAFPADYEKYVAGMLEKIPAKSKAAVAIYEARIEVCRQCERLDNGTCMGCGCLVELKAAYMMETCPFGAWKSADGPKN